jgi:hypothetical protein
LFFPPLPNGTARMGHPAFALFNRTGAQRTGDLLLFFLERQRYWATTVTETGMLCGGMQEFESHA